MKRTALFALAGVALLGAAACSKTGVQEAPKGITAIAEEFRTPDESTKSEFDFSTPGKAQFKWSAGDQIAVANNDSENSYKLLLTLQGDGGTSEGSFGSAEELAAYRQFSSGHFFAAYPADKISFTVYNSYGGYDLSTIAFDFRVLYEKEHVGKMEPMCLAYVKKASGMPPKIEFRHVAAMVKLSIKNLPSGVVSVHFNTPNKIVTGIPSLQSFQAADGVIEDISVGSAYSEMYRVANLLDDSVIKPVTDFYMPVPAGEFPSGYKVSVNMVSSANTFSYEVTSSKTLNVGQMACINLKVEADASAPSGYKLVADK